MYHPCSITPCKEKRNRGFNQAQRLAVRLAGHRNLPMESSGLRRVKHTETQTNLSRKEHKANMHGALEGSKKMSFARVLLVDDAMTTGATASACAAAPQWLDVQNVGVLTLERGVSV